MITVDCNNPARFDSSGFRGNYEYVGRDSHHWETVEYFKKYEWNFVFIDGDHSYEGVKADFNNVLPLLKKGTLVAFHDVVISDFHHIHGCYVGEFWNDLKQERPDFKFEQITTNDEWAGIGLVEI
jgi:cephalosporin hydroxylase